MALAVVASSVPLYGLVKREYVPSDVDEAEFQISFEGPEGLSLAGMDEAVQAMDREIRAVRGVRLVLLERRRQLPRPGEPPQRRLAIAAPRSESSWGFDRRCSPSFNS